MFLVVLHCTLCFAGQSCYVIIWFRLRVDLWFGRLTQCLPGGKGGNDGDSQWRTEMSDTPARGAGVPVRSRRVMRAEVRELISVCGKSLWGRTTTGSWDGVEVP